jgi:hypothetical protein
MWNNITRSRMIQVWFAAVALVVAAGITLGVDMTLGTGALLAALCLVPPAIILMLWPGAERRTIAEVLHDAERRG